MRKLWIGAAAEASYQSTLAHWRLSSPSAAPRHAVRLLVTGAATQYARHWLAHGMLLQTECDGPLAATLHQIGGQVDAIELDTASLSDQTDVHVFKALARCCKPGTQLQLLPSPPRTSHSAAWRAWLCASGFTTTQRHDSPNEWIYAPAWPRRSPRHIRPQPLPASSCIVIGAGLAGAAAAASLARRGWYVTVLEAATPAHAASAVPVGLLSEHPSSDDNVLSQLSRVGMQATWEQAQQLLTPDDDFKQTGVWRQDAARCAAPAAPLAGGWIKPAQFVRAWLDHPQIHIKSHCRTERLLPPADTHADWQALDSNGRLLASGRLVVLAAGHASAGLAGTVSSGAALASLQQLRGQMSWGSYQANSALQSLMPHHPVNGQGSFIPGVSAPDELRWYSGASYQRGDADTSVRTADQRANLERLVQLLPETGAQLAEQLGAQAQTGGLHDWVGLRCASADRLPLVGPVCRPAIPYGAGPAAASLWTCCALGSRGLTFAALSAELLAAWLHQEPLPMPARLADKLRAWR